jgi:hypothetical protein
VPALTATIAYGRIGWRVEADRAALDGTIDPVAWAGTPATAGVPSSARIRSGEASARALHEILLRCAKAGVAACSFAGTGDALSNFAKLTSSLKRAPLSYTDPTYGTVTVTYADLIEYLQLDLYLPDGDQAVSDDLTNAFSLWIALAPTSLALSSQLDHDGLIGQRKVPLSWDDVTCRRSYRYRAEEHHPGEPA